MRTWMRLIPAVLLVIAFTNSARAADVETDKKIDQLKTEVAQLRKDLDNLKVEVNARGARVAEDLQEIKNLLRDMANRPPLSRQSGYDPRSLLPGAPSATPLPTTGTITLQNVYPAPATVRINGQPYFVDANQTREVRNVPIGPFQYSVDVEGYGTVEPLRSDTLRPAGYLIRIYPRMPL